MKKILLSLAMIVAVGAVVVGATGAFLSDTETSSGNTFTAGAVDLKIDNTSYYNGKFNDETSWSLKDLGEGDWFFNFLDLKPGDWGEDTISVHVETNDAWACMDAELTATDDNGLNEPEQEDGDNTGGEGEGELQNFVNFVWWADDGDNVLEDSETDRIFHENVSLAQFGHFGVVLADSTGLGVLSEGPLDGTKTYYIGKAWCFGEFTLSPVAQDGDGFLGNEGANGPDVRYSGIECDGSQLDNTTQTDSVVGNLSFRAEQSRNNPNFTCGPPGLCSDKIDVMLVLDRSGSINDAEEAAMKNAAKAFVDALSPLGVANDPIVGMASFGTTGTLDQQLTDVAQDVKDAIDALTTPGSSLTNLQEGIELATAELTSVRDRLDADAPDFMVIITDGAPTASSGPGSHTQDAIDAANAAKAAGIEIYVVGVGTVEGTADFLRDDIATDAAHYFDADDFADLQAILEGLTDCPNKELLAQ